MDSEGSLRGGAAEGTPAPRARQVGMSSRGGASPQVNLSQARPELRCSCGSAHPRPAAPQRKLGLSYLCHLLWTEVLGERRMLRSCRPF